MNAIALRITDFVLCLVFGLARGAENSRKIKRVTFVFRMMSAELPGWPTQMTLWAQKYYLAVSD